MIPMRLIVQAATFCALVLAAGIASGQSMPSVAVERGSLVTPTFANNYYAGLPGGLNARALNTEIDPRVEEVGRALRGDPDAIFEYVAQNVETSPHFGLQKGATGALLDRAGTAFDQAELMAHLMRSSGGDAQYRYGTVTLNHSQMQEWLGVTNGLEAEQLLADAGVPATVSGTGSSYNATIAHIWVELRPSGGSWVAYDPALKRHDYEAGLDLTTLTGFNASTFLTAAAADHTGTTSGGTDWVAEVDDQEIYDRQVAYATNYIDAIEANATYSSSSLEEIAGGRVLDGTSLTGLPPAGDNTVYFNNYTWAGEIPNALRTTLRIEAPLGTLDHTYYVDDIYSARVTLRWEALDGYLPDLDAFSGPDHPTQFQLRLYSGHMSANAIDTEITGVTYRPAIHDPSAYRDVSGAIINPSSATEFYDVTLTLNLPYAAESGAYIDMVYDQSAPFFTQQEIVIAIGEVTRHASEVHETTARASRFYGVYQSDGQDCEIVYVGSPPSQEIECDPDPGRRYWQEPYDDLSLAVPADIIWRQWAGSLYHSSEILAAQAGARIVHHASVGMIHMGGASGQNPFGGAPSVLDVVTTASIPYSTINVGEVAQVYATLATTFEAAMWRFRFEEQYSSYYSAGSVLSWRDSGVSQNRFLEFDPNGFDGTELSNYNQFALDLMDDYSTAGFSVVVAEDANAMATRPWTSTFPGDYDSPKDANGVATGNLVGFYAFRFSAAEPEAETAFILLDLDSSPGSSAYKGGGSVDTSAPELPSPDVEASISGSPIFSSNSVDLRTGYFTHAPGPDLVVGTGELPYALPFQRQYSSARAAAAPLGRGWTHNWDIFASEGSSATQITLPSDARMAAPTVAIIESALAASTLAGMAERTLFLSHLSEVYQSFLLNNTVTVTQGGSTTGFVQMPDGTYLAGGANNTTLTRSSDSLGTSGFTMATPDEVVIQFSRLAASEVGKQDGEPRRGWMNSRFYATDMDYPDGIQIDLTYRTNTGVLSRVENNLGRELAFDYGVEDNLCFLVPYGDGDPRWPACGFRLEHYRLIQRAYDISTPDNQAIYNYNRYQESADRLIAVYTPENIAGYQFTYPVSASTTDYLFDVTGNPITYAYTDEDHRLTDIYLPSDQTTPVLSVSYQLDGPLLPGRVNQLTVRMGTSQTENWEYYIAGYRGETQPPAGPVSASWFDEFGRLAASGNLNSGMVTENTYDGIGRLIETRLYDLPDGRDLYRTRTVHEYDALHNRIRTTVHPRWDWTTTGPGHDPIVTEWEYTDLDWPYRPTLERDPNGNETHTSYDSVTGLVTQTLGPSGEQTNYCYFTLGSLIGCPVGHPVPANPGYGQPIRIETEAGQ